MQEPTFSSSTPIELSVPAGNYEYEPLGIKKVKGRKTSTKKFSTRKQRIKKRKEQRMARKINRT